MNPPKLIRLLFAATVVAGVSAPMLSAYAAPRKSSVDVYNMPKGFTVPGATPANRLEININDTVGWNILEGDHTITPKDSKQWGDGGSDTINGDSPQYVANHFTKGGDYIYYCKIHGGIDNSGNPTGMWGVIHVIDNAPTTTTTTTPPATTPPTQPPTSSTTVTTRQLGSTPPATTATAPTSPAHPGPTAPATTTTAKAEKDKKAKDETTTTTTAPPPPLDIPDSAIIPTLPSTSTPANPDPGAPAPADAPEGDAVALLKGKKNDGGGAMKLLIVSGLGLGVLGFGTAGYKYANRSSKYFPA